MSGEQSQVVVRIPVALRASLQASADANERTLSGEIRWRLTRSLAEPSRGALPGHDRENPT